MRTANAKIHSLTQRGKLAVRAAPYFNTIAPKRLLGYGKAGGTNAAGRWVVQLEIGRTGSGQPVRRRQALGVADDLAPANGKDVLSYDQALAAAIEWNPSEKKEAHSFTVRDAVEQHRDFGGKRGDKTERAKTSAYNSLRWNVLREGSDGTPRASAKGLGDLPVAHLTTEMLKAWRDAMIRPDLKSTNERAYIASRASAERAWSDFRSCLEQAYKRTSNGIESADSWRNVESLGKKGNRREVHFTVDEALRYIEKARENGDRAEADLFEAYAWTGSRPGGELASLKVADFNARLYRLSIPDRDEQTMSKTGARQITLTDEAVTFFTRKHSRTCDISHCLEVTLELSASADDIGHQENLPLLMGA